MATLNPKFPELSKVRVIDVEGEQYEGYVVDSVFRDGRWLYQVSIQDEEKKTETYDNWVPEEWLTLVK